MGATSMDLLAQDLKRLKSRRVRELPEDRNRWPVTPQLSYPPSWPDRSTK